MSDPRLCEKCLFVASGLENCPRCQAAYPAGLSKDEVLAALLEIGCRIKKTGSQVTCCPPPMGSDVDYIVLAASEDMLSDVVALISEQGFHWEGSDHYQEVSASSFTSWRCDDHNLIVTKNKSFYEKHALATQVCKRLNLQQKSDRIAVFQVILYDNYEQPAVVS